MKTRIIKKGEGLYVSRTKKSGGFALLFSVLLASLLLTIGLSIFSIALKELAISTASRQSVHAFYAADSGRECVKYWDTKMGQIPTVVNYTPNGGTITCGKKIMSLLNNGYTSGDITYIPGGSTSWINDPAQIVFVGGDSSIGPNFRVTITKTKDIISGNIQTTINSYGHDSTGGDRVERAIRQDY